MLLHRSGGTILISENDDLRVVYTGKNPCKIAGYVNLSNKTSEYLPAWWFLLAGMIATGGFVATFWFVRELPFRSQTVLVGDVRVPIVLWGLRAILFIAGFTLINTARKYFRANAYLKDT